VHCRLFNALDQILSDKTCFLKFIKCLSFLIDGLGVNDAADHVGQQITITLAFVVRLDDIDETGLLARVSKKSI
jgi:hypothetical protein